MNISLAKAQKQDRLIDLIQIVTLHKGHYFIPKNPYNIMLTIKYQFFLDFAQMSFTNVSNESRLFFL